jgi:hypothetical protein
MSNSFSNVLVHAQKAYCPVGRRRSGHWMNAMRAAFPLLASVVFFLGNAATPLRAQFETGVVVGRLSDPTGAAVANAEVKLTNVALGTTQMQKSSAQGDYEFPGVPDGSYVVTVEAASFDTATTVPVTVTVGSRQRVDIKLQVGTFAQDVTVSLAAPQLETDTSDRSLVVDMTELQDLPLNGRHYTDLALLAPGVQLSGLQDGSITQRLGSLNVNGMRSSVNNFLLDGLDNNAYEVANQGFNNEALTESVDAIDQFRISTANYSAEYGRAGGGIINVSTRRGTNDFHESVWEYLRNTALDAYGPLLGTGVKPVLVQNQFGATAGGPIRRNSLFFFADYEGFRQVSRAYQTATIPSLAERQGNFVAALTTTSGSILPIKNPYTGAVYTNGMIPTKDITPFAAAVLAALPVPTDGNNMYVSLPRSQNYRDIGDVRLDWIPHHSLLTFLRYSQQSNHITEGPHIPGVAGGDGNGRERILATQVASGITYTLTPRTLFDARVGLTWSEAGKVPYNQGQPSLDTEFGIQTVTNPYLISGLNEQDIATFSYLGSQDTDPQYSNPHTINPKLNVTLIRAKHSFSIGYEYLALIEDLDSQSAKFGYDEYDGYFTAPATADRVAANNIADFLYGARSKYELSNFNPDTINMRFHYAYIADTWRVANRLTLNLGLRYEFQIPQFTSQNHQANFDPVSNTLILAQNGSLYSRSLVNPRKANFAPRLGFAFSSDPRTVWRGAYGISYVEFNRFSSQGSLDLNGPYSVNSVVSQSLSGESLCATGSQSTTCFRPTVTGDPASIISPASFSTLTSMARYVPKDSPTGYVQSYSFGVQTQLTRRLVSDIAYVGTHAVHLRVLGDYNQAEVQPLTTSCNSATTSGCLAIQARRPLAGFEDIYDNLSAGFTDYNSLQVRLQGQLGRFTFINAFTWSRDIDNAVADLEELNGDSSVVNYDNIKGDTGTSGYNQPLNESLGALWNVPAPATGSRLVRALTNQWQLTTITRLTSGVPINFYYSPSSTANTTDLAYQYRPNVTGFTSTLMNPRSKWVQNASRSALTNVYSTTQLTVPSVNVVYGNTPRNVIRGTPYYDVDLGAHKDFTLPKHSYIQFRVEAFNLLNHTNWKSADSGITDATYGQLASSNAFPSRQIQLAIKVIH